MVPMVHAHRLASEGLLLAVTLGFLEGGWGCLLAHHQGRTNALAQMPNWIWGWDLWRFLGGRNPKLRTESHTRDGWRSLLQVEGVEGSDSPKHMTGTQAQGLGWLDMCTNEGPQCAWISRDRKARIKQKLDVTQGRWPHILLLSFGSFPHLWINWSIQ